MTRKQTNQNQVILDALRLTLTEQARTHAMLDATHELIEKLLPKMTTIDLSPHEVFVTTKDNAIDRNFHLRMEALEKDWMEIEAKFQDCA